MAQPFPKFFSDLWEAGAEIYEVGGSVRDRLLNIPHKDQDLVVRNLSFEKLKSLLTPYGKVALVGKSFGVLKFSPHQGPAITYDIALPRKERSTGTGHRDFEIDYDPTLPIEEDLWRRDFTINAMARDLKTERLIDPTGGQKDLSKKILRQVFEKSFEEDPLRLIRAIQFAARFELTIEGATWEAMKKQASLIRTVSDERVIEEIKKMLSAKKPSVGIDWMQECGLLKPVFPELEAIRSIEQDKRPGDDVYQHTMRVLDAARADEHVEHAGDLELLLAALFHDVGKATTRSFDKEKNRIVFYGHQLVSKRMCRKWLTKMRVETIGVNPSNILTLVEHHMFETKSYFTDKAIRRFVAKIGKDLIFKLLDLRLADNRGGKHPKSINGVLKMRERVREELAKKPPFGPKDLAINGHDMMAMGVLEGPAIGKILNQLVEIVLDDPALNTKEHLLVLAKQMEDTIKNEDQNPKGKASKKQG